MESKFEINSQFSSLDDLIASYGGKDLKLDLGCGYYKPKGFIGIDNGVGFPAQMVNQSNVPDIIMNIDRNDLPFADNSCAVVRASHFLEHTHDMIHIVDEIYRILVPETGLFRIILPYASSALGLYPGHYVYFTEKWFHDSQWFQEHWDIKKEIYTKSEYWKKAPWLLRFIFPFDWARIFLFNACEQMELHCYPKKPTP